MEDIWDDGGVAGGREVVSQTDSYFSICTVFYGAFWRRWQGIQLIVHELQTERIGEVDNPQIGGVRRLRDVALDAADLFDLAGRLAVVLNASDAALFHFNGLICCSST
jgi:hypothetical protein